MKSYIWVAFSIIYYLLLVCLFILFINILIIRVLFKQVSEVKSLGKNTIIGEKNCDTLELFRAQPQAHSFSLNASGSVRLTLITQWLFVF